MQCQHVYFSVQIRPGFVFSLISILQLCEQWILSSVSTVNIDSSYMLFSFILSLFCFRLLCYLVSVDEIVLAFSYTVRFDFVKKHIFTPGSQF